MSEAERAQERDGNVSVGAIERLVRALEVLLSAHASRARDEASRDISRIGAGAVLLVLALALVAPALLLLDLAAVLVIQEHLRWGWAASCVAVAALDVVVAGLALTAARARLAAPVLVETRSTLKRAALVIRGA
ncbi:MAG: phage holin family protein [Myxococcales bacterium]|nr:phage holin family protein [Myxococcales bacterium]